MFKRSNFISPLRSSLSAGLLRAMACLFVLAVASPVQAANFVMVSPNVLAVTGHIGPGDWSPVGPLAELPERTPTRRLVGDVGVVLVRDGEQVRGLADRCSHASAPLSEGTLSEGTLDDDPERGRCLTCPWHGSVFRVADGAVLHPDRPRFDLPCLSFTWEVAAPPGWRALDPGPGLVANDPDDPNDWPCGVLGLWIRRRRPGLRRNRARNIFRDLRVIKLHIVRSAARRLS